MITSRLSIPLLAMLYFAAAKASLFLAFENTHASPVWPPSGLAFAAVILAGPRVWPGILLGAFAANLLGFLASQVQPLWVLLAVSLQIAIGNALEALLGWLLLRHWVPAGPFGQAQGGIRFVAVALFMCLASAMVGPASLCFWGLAPWESLPSIAFTWWLGDATGVLVLTPLLLLLAGRPAGSVSWGRRVESATLLLTLVVVAQGVFGGWLEFGGIQPMAYAITPILILVAFRSGPLTASLGMVLVAFTAILGTVRGTGPLSGASLNDNLLLVQSFVGVIAITVLFLNSSLADRSAAVSGLEDAKAALESRVEERTLALRQTAQAAEAARKEAEAAQASLQQSERQYRDLFENARDTLLIIDPASNRFLAVNSRAVEQLGYSREEFAGMNAGDLEGDPDPEVQAEKRRRFARDGRLLGEHLHRCKDGRILPVEVSATLIDYAGKKVVQVISRDLSDRQRHLAELQESESRFRKLSDAAFEGLTLHENGRIILANRALAELLGYAQEELVGMTPARLAAPESLALVRERIAAGSEAPYEAVGLRKDGTRIHVEICGRQIEYQGRTLRVTAMRDISARKRTEALQAQAMAAVKAADAAKSQFLATMSHEIRTPLNGILGMTKALAGTTLDAEQRRFAAMLKECGQALLAQVNDILDLSKIESGSMAMDSAEFDLLEAVRKSAVATCELGLRPGVALHSSLECLQGLRVRGDSNRLGQILRNLGGNAVKFTERGSVAIRAELLDSVPQSLRVRFSVEDTGIGIAPEAVQRLFEPFFQADATMSRRYGGSGLGLAICSQLARLMGATLEVESQPGAGSRFRLIAPFERVGPAMEAPASLPPAVPEPAPRPGAPSDQKPPRVLVVEDDPVNQEVARIFLQRHAREVEIVDNGLDALARVEQGGFDLVLMDCHLPGMDGLETTRAIRAREGEGPHVRIVAMTANAFQGDREKCLRAGMDDYLSKPLDEERLADIFRS